MPNLSTLLVGLVVLAIFVAIVARGIYNRKQGKGGCACGCDQCPGRGLCHPEELPVPFRFWWPPQALICSSISPMVMEWQSSTVTVVS